MTIYVSISIVISVVIIPTLAVVNTGITGGGDTVCVGIGAESDRLTVASSLVNNCLLLSGEVSDSAT